MAPIDAVVAVFSGLLSLALVRTMPSLVRFYSWFKDSGLKLAEHRGYGQSACKFYGLFSAPKLSVAAMCLAGIAFLVCVILPALPLTPAEWRAPLLGAALVPYHLYFSQLYCEAHVGAHVTVLIPPALLLLALSPSLDADALDTAPSADKRAACAAFTCWMMKAVLTSAYAGAGVCKICHSISSMRAGGVSWTSGSTLQAFIFEAMFLSTPDTHTSFGVPTPLSHAIQRLHVRFPRLLLMPAATGAVAFETLAPLLLLAPARLASLPFAASGLAFHYGIALLQNIDFFSWWSPAYAFLLADPAAWAAPDDISCAADGSSPLSLSGSIDVALRVAPLRASLALAYVAVHVLAVILLRFFPEAEILPLSTFPMFGKPHNLFDRASRKWFWLTGKPHATGTLKNYAFPFCRPQTVQPDELQQLPFPYLLYGHGASAPTAVFTNVDVTPPLAAALAKLTALGSQDALTFATDPSSATQILAVLDEAKAAFSMAPRLTALPKELDALHEGVGVGVDATPPTADALLAPATANPVAPGITAAAAHQPALVNRPVILFDGVCLLCSGFVHFVLDHDAAGAFDFAPLQGEVGTALLTKAGLPHDVSTMVLIDEHERVYTRSTAALNVIARCGWPYYLVAHAALCLPRPLRDLGYKTVAAMRYRLFGKDDGSTCRRMSKTIRHRFL